jgi:1,4-dihydroxy-2-naphthoate octaprenyltransferase
VTFTTWIRAARLRTIPLSVSGILVGSAAALLKNEFNVSVFTLAILTTVCYQLLSNYANDYGDGIKGTDNDERLGPKRILQSELISRTQLRQAIFVISGVAVLLTILLVYSAFGLSKTAFTFLGLGFLAIFAAIRYTVGSSAYGYKGFGDLFVFLFFGCVSVLGSHYLFTFEFDFSLIFPAISIGLLSVGVLNINNMRDRVNDKQFGKTTIAVRLGAEKSALYQLALVVTPLILTVVYGLIYHAFAFFVMSAIMMIPISHHLNIVFQKQSEKALDPELKKIALLTFFYAISFSLLLIFF